MLDSTCISEACMGSKRNLAIWNTTTNRTNVITIHVKLHTIDGLAFLDHNFLVNSSHIVATQNWFATECFFQYITNNLFLAIGSIGRNYQLHLWQHCCSQYHLLTQIWLFIHCICQNNAKHCVHWKVFDVIILVTSLMCLEVLAFYKLFSILE